MRRLLSLFVSLALAASVASATTVPLTGAGHNAGSSCSGPAVQTTASTTSAGTTSLAVNLPSGLVSGDLLLLVIMQVNNGRNPAVTGWTSLYDQAAGTTGEQAAFYKTSNGAEGATVTMTWPSSPSSTGILAFRINCQVSNTPEVGTAAASADPPALTLAGGSAAALWMAVVGYRTNPTAVTAPTNYANLLQTSGQQLSIARRSLTAATENPGVFTVTGGATPIAETIGIH